MEEVDTLFVSESKAKSVYQPRSEVSRILKVR